jgi:hypothetical protein
MTRRLCLVLCCALVPTALLSGCGGGGSSAPDSHAAQVKAAKQNTARAYADCVKATKNSGLSSTERTILQSECSDIKSGDGSALIAAGKQLCKVEATQLPPAERATVLAACKEKAP